MPEVDHQPEQVMLENEPANRQPHQPPHVHHGMIVACQHGADTITIPPTFKLDGHHRYVRTEDKNADGLYIFRPEAAP